MPPLVMGSTSRWAETGPSDLGGGNPNRRPTDPNCRPTDPNPRPTDIVYCILYTVRFLSLVNDKNICVSKMCTF